MQFLKDLIGFLQNLPLVKVTFGFEPTQSFLMRLNNQISAFISKKAILDILIDENVIGGAVFEYNGKISHQTLQKKLDNELVSLVSRANSDSAAQTNQV